MAAASEQGAASCPAGGLESDPTWIADLERSRATVFFKAGRYEEAIAAYTASLDAMKDQPVVWGNRAAARLKLGRLDEAEADCSEAVTRDPKHAKAFARRATVRAELGKWSGALRDVEAATRLGLAQPGLAEVKERAIAALLARRPHYPWAEGPSTVEMVEVELPALEPEAEDGDESASDDEAEQTFAQERRLASEAVAQALSCLKDNEGAEAHEAVRVALMYVPDDAMAHLARGCIHRSGVERLDLAVADFVAALVLGGVAGADLRLTSALQDGRTECFFNLAECQLGLVAQLRGTCTCVHAGDIYGALQSLWLGKNEAGDASTSNVFEMNMRKLQLKLSTLGVQGISFSGTAQWGAGVHAAEPMHSQNVAALSPLLRAAHGRVFGLIQMGFKMADEAKAKAAARAAVIKSKKASSAPPAPAPVRRVSVIMESTKIPIKVVNSGGRPWWESASSSAAADGAAPEHDGAGPSDGAGASDGGAPGSPAGDALPPRPDPEQLMSGAESALASRDYSLAEGLYQEYLEARPNDTRAWAQLAKCRNDRGNGEGAVEALERGLAVEEPLPKGLTKYALLFRLGGVQSGMGMVTTALETLERAERHAASAKERAEVAKHIQSNLQARGCAPEPLVGVLPREAAPASSAAAAAAEEERQKGNELYKACSFLAAFNCYEKAAELDPTSVPALTNAASALLRLHQYPEAIDWATRALELDPRSWKAYLRRATAHWAIKDHEAAWDDFHRVAFLEPKHKEAHAQLRKLQAELEALSRPLPVVPALDDSSFGG